MATDHRLLERDFGYIRRAYRVPAKVGGRVVYTGGGTPREGTIIGVENAHLRIRLDGDKLSGLYHPTWCLSYEKEIAHV